MAAGGTLSLLQAPACLYYGEPSCLRGAFDRKLVSTGAAKHLGQEHSADRTAAACRGFARTTPLSRGPHKERQHDDPRPCYSLPGTAAEKRIRLPGSSSWPRYLTVTLNGWVVRSITFALGLLCCVRLAACVSHFEGEQHARPDATQVRFAPHEDFQARAISLMRNQVAQMARQKVLESEAEPSLYSPENSTIKSLVMLQLGGSTATTAESKSAAISGTSKDLGAVLLGEADGGGSVMLAVKRGMDMRGGPLTAESAPYSFLNWGQIGGMMQNPALAHTGMPVYMPRQVVGTTIGLDFDSPATFHGPLLVLLMVCILIFFVVLLLCCWMVKSKQRHDKFMAEKLPH
ncbi:hypothetical protein, conserved [Eimeria brunetti]|uniref:Uncharacterized protein n=1 Tax=Eimeria brunetti TaxID=51314 RepID=U6LIH5_9EIME|nr:hypothetical protein, conserved [Eimeria brunetti]